MYYKLLFEGLAADNKEGSKRGGFGFEIFGAGEDLLQRYLKMKACGCNNLSVVVTDYNMGPKKYNGVETAIMLRKSEYNGIIVLRTSEEISYLTKKHPDFAEMLEAGFINHFVPKSSVKKTKELLQELIKGKLLPANRWSV